MGALSRREQIGQAALSVLGREGARGLTHRAVDVEAGLSPGSVNHHAPTRELLLEAALDALFEQNVTTAQGRRRGARALPDQQLRLEDVADGLASLVAALSTPAPRAFAKMELLCEAQRRPSFRARFDQRRNEFVTMAGDLLTAIGAPDSRAAADGLVTLVDGLVVRQVMIGESRMPDAHVAAMFRPYLAAARQGLL